MPSTTSSGVFRVHYTGRNFGPVVVPIVFLSMLFAVVLSFYLNDDTRWMFGRNLGPGKVKAFRWLEFLFFLALVIAPLFDLIVTLSYARREAVALEISKEGVTGRIFHRTKHLDWSEIDRVSDGSRTLTFHKTSRTGFFRIPALTRHGGPSEGGRSHRT